MYKLVLNGSKNKKLTSKVKKKLQFGMELLKSTNEDLTVSLNSSFGNLSRYHSLRNADLEHLERMSQNRIVTALAA
jgi:hypothetical protein